MTNQVWNINGRQYTWGQLQQLKKQKLEPKTAEVVYVAPEVTEEEREEIAEAHEVEDLIKDDVDEELPTNFLQLKKLAKEQGMTVTPDTKKEEVMEFLKNNLNING